MDLIKLGQMLCSRLCHDIINPIGAINSSFDLLESLEESDRSELMELAQGSASKALSKVVFYRTAFGFSTGALHSSINQIKKIFESFLNSINIDLLWNEEDSQVIDWFHENQQSLWLQFIANVILICSEIAPFGGQIFINVKNEDESHIHIVTRGKLVLLKPIISEILRGHYSEDAITSQTIHLLYTYLLSTRLKINLSIDEKEREELIIKITKYP